ncbi:MAG: molybdopterin molybdotransferase [Bacteroidia bacterium]
MLPVQEALSRILGSAQATAGIVSVALLDALGLTLAEDIVSTIAVPPQDNSAMDGYALRVADAGQSLPVSQRIPAGAVGSPLAPGSAARIFTGAPVPAEADCVVMQEDCVASDGEVTVGGGVSVGDNIRPRGQDINIGETALYQGRRLRPQDLGLLASLGLAEIPVYRPLQVAVLSTGDELVEPGTGAAPPGSIFNSNRYTLGGLIRSLGFEFVDCGIVEDSPEATAAALESAAGKADCVITTGGVSVGEEDHVKEQVQNLGELALWKLAIKPGKPLAFGRIGSTPFIGLPGNPTSVFVTFCLIARPFLLQLQGVSEPALPSLQARAGFALSRPGKRQEYLRVTLVESSEGLLAQRFPNQSSGVLSSVSHSNALAVIPPGTVVQEGQWLEVLLLDTLIG